MYGDFDTAPDVLRRFHQFESSENDRASYSLACQLDGTCPVNFRDELTKDDWRLVVELKKNLEMHSGDVI